MNREFWLSLIPRLLRGGWRERVATVEDLKRFVSTRAAFIAQKTLYGYLKTRIGTRFPSMFSDDVYIASVNIAKMHVFAACLSDLAVHAVATGLGGAGASEEELRDAAVACFTKGLADNAAQATEQFDPQEARKAFATRLASVDWAGTAKTADAFSASPRALVRWAPIADSLKKHDAEQVRNSIRFAWREIRRELERRLDKPALAQDARSAGLVAATVRRG